MTQIDAVITLLHITEEEIRNMDDSQLRDWLGSIRFVSRQIEHEIIRREISSLHHGFAIKE